MDTVPTPPESTKTSLRQRLRARANQRWPQLADLTIRHHGGFAYVNGQLRDATTLPLFRLRYGGSANSWGFAIHLASRNGYEDTVLPSGYPRRHPRRSPRLRLRPLPQRPNRLGPTPDELTGVTTSGVSPK